MIDDIDHEIEILEQETNQLPKSDERFKRPPINLEEDFNPQQDLYLMQIDCDYYVTNQGSSNDDKNNQYPVIRMFCLNKKGNSVLLHIKGFLSYFYLDYPFPQNAAQNDPKFDESVEVTKFMN